MRGIKLERRKQSSESIKGGQQRPGDEWETRVAADLRRFPSPPSHLISLTLSLFFFSLALVGVPSSLLIHCVGGLISRSVPCPSQIYFNLVRATVLGELCRKEKKKNNMRRAREKKAFMRPFE